MFLVCFFIFLFGFFFLELGCLEDCFFIFVCGWIFWLEWDFLVLEDCDFELEYLFVLEDCDGWLGWCFGVLEDFGLLEWCLLELEYCFVRGGSGGGGLDGGGKGEGLVRSLIWLIVSYILVDGFCFFWVLCDFLDFLVVGMFILNLVRGLLIFGEELLEWLILMCVDLWDFLSVNEGDVVGFLVEFKLKFFWIGIFFFVFVFILWDDG